MADEKSSKRLEPGAVTEGDAKTVVGNDSDKADSLKAEREGKRDGKGKRDTPGSEKKRGKAKRRQKRLRNEPQSVAGEQTPIAINVLDFAEARATELQNMARALEAKPGEEGKRVFQQLPRHMRRRAMSHNVRRLPRRLQERAAREMSSAPSSVQKKSRKQSRKPRNLREENMRKQRNYAWLETHVWHAKRMHMKNYYGYRVAERANDKGVRQAYRSMRYGCLMSDISYQCCIELEGQRDDIVSCLSPFFNSDTGLSIAARPYASGSTAGHTVMYHAGQYPYGAIGPVEFLWQPSSGTHGASPVCAGTTGLTSSSSGQMSQSGSYCSTTISQIPAASSGPSASSDDTSQTGIETSFKPVAPDVRTGSTKLWLVVSPAVHGEVMTELSTAVECFCTGLKMPPNDVSVQTFRNGEEKASLQTSSPKPHPFVLKGCLESESIAVRVGEAGEREGGGEGEGVEKEGISKSVSRVLTVTSLKDEFVRFRLIGPRSHALVMETLEPVMKPVSAETPIFSSLSTSHPDLTKIPDPIPWWNGDTTLHDHTQLLSSCLGDLKNALSPADFLEGAVLGMVVEDPRLFTPCKRTDMVSAYYPKKVDVLKWVSGITSDVGIGGEGESGREEEEGDGGRERGGEVEGEMSDVEEGEPTSDSEHELMVVSTSEGERNGEHKERENVELPLELAYSTLWDPGIRRTVKESHVLDHLLNDVRSKLLTKSPVLSLGRKSPRIPVLLIRQAYSSRVDGVLHLEGGGCSSGYRSGISQSITTSLGSGWDLVLPSNWAMAFWVALVYRGARACGMEELQKCYLECGVPSFPLDYPDTQVGRRYAEGKQEEAEQKFHRYPPDKRRNYGKLLIQDVFCSPWSKLVSQWRSQSRIDRLLCDQIPSACLVSVSNAHGTDSTEQSGFDSGEETELDVSYIEPLAKRPRIDGNTELGRRIIERNVAGSVGMLTQSSAVVKEIQREREGEGVKGEREEEERDELGRQITVECGANDGFYILRSKSALLQLSQFFCFLCSLRYQSHSSTTPGPTALAGRLQELQSFQTIVKNHGIDSLLTEHQNSLVAICFEMLQRGNASQHAIISAPTSADLRDLATKRHFHGPEETICPKGLTVVDGNAICVGMSGLTRRQTHQVKAQRKKKALERCRLEQTFNRSKEEVVGKITRDFHLLPVTQSRVIIGYTTSTGYRLCSSKNGGIAFCSLAGLLEAARQNYNFHTFGSHGGRETVGDGVRVVIGEGVKGGDKEGMGGGKCVTSGGRMGRRRGRGFELLVLVRSESLHHHFARFKLLLTQ